MPKVCREVRPNHATRIRAAVLGANDGIVSIASLIVGVAAAAATKNDVLIAGIVGLVAGAMPMAAGEYVSVSSQSDTERTDIARERKELSENPAFELDELADIYVKRGVALRSWHVSRWRRLIILLDQGLPILATALK